LRSNSLPDAVTVRCWPVPGVCFRPEADLAPSVLLRFERKAVERLPSRN